jgi:hypothetical protein
MARHDDDEPQDRLLERLHETAAGDASVRRLRRSYDLLRRDYEELLDRLADLEERLETATPAPATAAAPPKPQTIESAPSALLEQITAPLVRLRDEYAAALSRIQAIVGGLDNLAAGAMKGQRGPSAVEHPAVTEEPAGRPRRIQVDVKGPGFGSLLDFQERLSALDGVARVTISAVDQERATFVVELGTPN